MNNWDYKKLSKLCSRIGDGLHGTPEYLNDSDIYFINGNNLNNGKIELNSNTKKVSVEEFENNFIPLNENSLLLSINGTIGSMAFYNDEKVMLGKSAAYLNFNSGINKFYYYYFQLAHIQRHFYNIATGSTIKNLSLKSIQDFEVPVPNEIEWQGIARALSLIDSKIEINNKINAELEAMAKILYDYWFVQFDFPDENGKPYNRSGGKMVWSEELKKEIPESWEVKKISTVAQFVNGKGIKKEYLSNFGKFPVYGSNGITGFTNEAHFKNSVISIGRVGANYGEVHYSLDPCWITDNAVTAQPYQPYYLWWLINSLKGIDYKKIAGGSAQPLITQGQLKDIKFALPEDSVFDKFHTLVNSAYLTVNSNIKQSHTLNKLRDWLLPMLMNGQVKVN